MDANEELIKHTFSVIYEELVKLRDLGYGGLIKRNPELAKTMVEKVKNNSIT